MPSNMKITDYVNATSALLKQAEGRAAAAEARAAGSSKQAADLGALAEAVADSLIASGQYKSAQRAQVVAGLKDHARALKLVAKMASTLKAAEAPATIGQPVSASKAAEASLSPFVGQPTTKKKASDLAFESYLNR